LLGHSINLNEAVHRRPDIEVKLLIINYLIPKHTGQIPATQFQNTATKAKYLRIRDDRGVFNPIEKEQGAIWS